MNVATAGLAGDTKSLDALRASAGRDPKSAIREAAKQFEALFMQQLMKSMRETSLSSGMLDNAGSQMGTELLDAQFATKMTGQPGGLADAITRQLERQMGVTMPATATPAAAAANAPAPTAEPAPAASGAKAATDQLCFLQNHLDAALAAQAQSGIPAPFMMAQAAHESGWGRREIRNADGSASYNLFGIKAGASWKGPVAEITTTEFVDGVAQKVSARFRAYGSYAESFSDYAKLMKDSPRYAPVLASAGSAQDFARGLQRAGYATDPAYADKLARTINTTLRLQRAVG